MIIDRILDRMDGEEYTPKRFYDAVRLYENPEYTDISMAMDYGEEKDVKRALCEYVIFNEYNPAICDYINSVSWLE